MKRTFNLILILTLWLVAAQGAWADDVVTYEVISEVPIVDDGQKTNWNSSEDYGSLVDGKTSTKYALSNADPWVEFHYSQAFVPKKYVLWTAYDTQSNSRRNPASWTIKAKLNKTDAWTTIATAENSGGNQLPTGNTQSKEYSIESNTNAYKYFRFEATMGSSGFQLGELQFKQVSENITVAWRMEGGLSQAAGLSETNKTSCVINGNTAELMTDSHTKTMRYTWNSGTGLLWTNTISERYTSFGYATFLQPQRSGCVVTFPNVRGKVTGLKMTNLDFHHDPGVPKVIKMFVGTKNGNNTSLMQINGSDHLESHEDGVPFTANFTSLGIDVDESTPLTIWFEGNEDENGDTGFNFSGSYHSTYGRKNSMLTLSYVPAAEPDAGHRFESSDISVNDNVLTATCTSSDANHNTLYGGANHKYTLILNAEDGVFSYYSPSTAFSATLTPSLSDFNTDTQLNAICTFNYHNNDTGADNTAAPHSAGRYTVTATIRINGTDYVLTKDFQVVEGKMIDNQYQQFDVNPKGGVEGETITVTFTPQMGESVATLTVTGNNTSMSLSDGDIIDNGNNTYTFSMPNENVTLGATFTFPMNDDNFSQDGDTYTIKNADGWDYFCQRMQYDANLDGFNGKTVELADDISVTTMAGMMHPFKGTFDGKGKTLNFNNTAAAMYTAPFQNTNSATICNLHVEGTITGGVNSYIGGLVGSSEGDLTIRDCHVSTQISTKYDSNTLSSNVGIGGIVGYIHYTTYGQKCQITGCVFDGLIYNPDYSGTTYGCGGFVGCLSDYVYVELTDCLFIEGQYDNNGGKRELLWGHDNNMNSTFFHRTNYQGSGTLKNCFFVATHFLKQGSPAVESATAPANFAHFGTPTDHRFMQTYGHTMLFGGKYYTPIYGDLVEKYDYSGGKSYNIEYDDAPLGIPDIASPLWTEGLRYNRSFTAGKPVTIMLPFNFKRDRITLAHDNANPSGKFYEFKGIEENQDHKWVAVMKEAGETLSNEVVETTLKANTPYLYVPAESTEYWDMYVSGGINIFTEGNEGGTKETEYDGWELRGTYTEKVWEENDPEIGKAYLIGDGGELIPVTAGTKIYPTDCYFILATSTINDVDISITIPSKEYTGSAQTPEITVKAGETTLTLDTDYTVTAPSGDCVNAGDYNFTITGAGEYKGSRTEKFTITKATIGLSWNSSTYDYDGTEKTVTATATGLVEDDACNVTLTGNTATAVGKYTATATDLDNTNYKLPESGLTCDYEIVRKMENLFYDDCLWAGYVAQEDLALPSGLTAYTVTALNGATATATALDYIPQDVPVLLGRTDNTVNLYRASAGSGTAPTVNLLQTASSTNQPTAFQDYVLYQDAFYLVSGGTLADGKVFLPADNGTTAPRLNIALGNGETTSLTPAPSPTGEGSGYWYTLDGRKLDKKPTQKGLYIHNGRKVVVK